MVLIKESHPVPRLSTAEAPQLKVDFNKIVENASGFTPQASGDTYTNIRNAIKSNIRQSLDGTASPDEISKLEGFIDRVLKKQVEMSANKRAGVAFAALDIINKYPGKVDSDIVGMLEAVNAGKVDSARVDRLAIAVGSYFSASAFNEIEGAIPYIAKQIFLGKSPSLYLYMSKGGDEASQSRANGNGFLPDLGEYLYFKRFERAGFDKVFIYDEFPNVGSIKNPEGNAAYIKMLNELLSGSGPELTVSSRIPKIQGDYDNWMVLFNRFMLPEAKRIAGGVDHNNNTDEATRSASKQLAERIKREEAGLAARYKIDENVVFERINGLLNNYRAIRRYDDPEDAWKYASMQVALASSKLTSELKDTTWYIAHTKKRGKLKIGSPIGHYSPTHGVPIIYRGNGGVGGICFEVVPAVQVAQFKRDVAPQANVQTIVDQKGRFMAYGISVDGKEIAEADVYEAVRNAVRRKSKSNSNEGQNLTMGMLNVVYYMNGSSVELIGKTATYFGVDDPAYTVNRNLVGHLSEKGVPQEQIQEMFNITKAQLRK